jgi:hypothetical protein
MGFMVILLWLAKALAAHERARLGLSPLSAVFWLVDAIGREVKNRLGWLLRKCQQRGAVAICAGASQHGNRRNGWR